MNAPPHDPDDWFDEPAVDPDARTRERPGRTGDDWFGGGRGRGRRSAPRKQATRFRILVAGGAAVVVLLIGLAAGGVFSGSARKRPTTPLTTRAAPPTTTQSTTTTPVVPPGTLKLGAHGTTVKDLQRALRSLGYGPRTADGVFGPSTERALIAFQTAKHLTADGVLGPATRAAMIRALRAQG